MERIIKGKGVVALVHQCISHSETETKLLTEQSVFTEKISLSFQFTIQQNVDPRNLKLKLLFQKHSKVNKKYNRHFIESLFKTKVENRNRL